MRYSSLLLDVFNLAHKLYEKSEVSEVVGPKAIYPNLVSKTIEKVKELKQRFGDEDVKVYLLFDYFSPSSSVKKPFKNFSDRKQISESYKGNRKAASQEFINSLAILRYYFLAQDPSYVTIQIQNREADDLVGPVFSYLEKEKTSLLVTNDSDWTRYLSSNIHYLPYLDGEPKTPMDFVEEKGYFPSINSVTFYKTVFGDDADNIPHLLPHNSHNHEEFKELIKLYNAPPTERFLEIAQQKGQGIYKILQAIRENPSQFQINLQLVEAQPISEKHFLSRLCIGRDSKIVTDSVEIALGIKQAKKTFVFGSISTVKDN